MNATGARTSSSQRSGSATDAPRRRSLRTMRRRLASRLRGLRESRTALAAARRQASGSGIGHSSERVPKSAGIRRYPRPTDERIAEGVVLKALQTPTFRHSSASQTFAIAPRRSPVRVRLAPSKSPCYGADSCDAPARRSPSGRRRASQAATRPRSLPIRWVVGHEAAVPGAGELVVAYTGGQRE
jgi:hypothetical protein